MADTPAHDKPVVESRVERDDLRAVLERLIFNHAFGAIRRWRGHGARKAEAAWVRAKNTLPRSWLNGCLFWPIMTVFLFSFMPPENRSIFAGVAAIGRQTHLGLVNQRMKVGELSSGGDASMKAIT